MALKVLIVNLLHLLTKLIKSESVPHIKAVICLQKTVTVGGPVVPNTASGESWRTYFRCFPYLAHLFYVLESTNKTMI